MNNKEIICGAAFEELSEEEMKEFEGGAFTVVLSSTTLPCIGASVVSVGASYVLSGIFG